MLIILMLILNVNVHFIVRDPILSVFLQIRDRVARKNISLVVTPTCVEYNSKEEGEITGRK